MYKAPSLFTIPIEMFIVKYKQINKNFGQINFHIWELYYIFASKRNKQQKYENH